MSNWGAEQGHEPVTSVFLYMTLVEVDDSGQQSQYLIC